MSFSRRKRSAFIICLTALLSIALFFILYDPAQPASSPASVPLTVTVIDAGQGDSILVTFGAETMLIDAAEKYESDDVLGALEKQGVDDIDILIASHPHDDHIGGLESVIEKYDIGKLYMADTPCETKTYGRLMEAVSDKDIPVLEAYAGVTFTLGQASCTIVSPDREDDFDANNESVALFVDYNDSEFLFTGDMEQKAEDELLLSGFYIDADVLKVAHHGSSTGTSEAFLQAVSPDYAVISCGKDNIYKHPHQSTLRLLDALDITTYRTDISGDVTFVSDGQSIKASVEKGAASQNQQVLLLAYPHI